MQEVLGGLQYYRQILSPEIKMKHAYDSQDQGLCTCCLGFSFKLNGYGVIVNGVIELYFGLSFDDARAVLGGLKYYHHLLSPEIK